MGNYRFKGASPNDLCIFVVGDRLDRVRPGQGPGPGRRGEHIVLRITLSDTNRQQGEQHRSGSTAVGPDKAYPAGLVCGSFTDNGIERPGACVSLHP